MAEYLQTGGIDNPIQVNKLNYNYYHKFFPDGLRDLEVIEGEGLYMCYNLSARLTPKDARLMVERGLFARFSVNFDQDVDARSGVEEGTMLELYRNFGVDCLPSSIEGFFCLYWRKYYQGTPFEDALDGEPVEFVEPQVKEELDIELIYLGERGPTISPITQGGIPPILDTLDHMGKRYALCKNGDGEYMRVPLVVRSIFHSRHVVPFTGNLTEASSYAENSLGYAQAYLQRHRQQMASIISQLKEFSFVEPGAGAGVVAALTKNVISGDPHPPEGAHPFVKKETFAETLARGPPDGIVVCSYIYCFLTKEDLELLSGRKVIWVDSIAIDMPGVQVGPGITFVNIDSKYFPKIVFSETGVGQCEPVYYTENLLNQKGYSIFRESKYVQYLRVMRPWMSLHYLPEYNGGMRGASFDDNHPVLCATVSEVIQARINYPTRAIYFAEIGRTLLPNERAGELIHEDADMNFYLKYRTLYRFPLVNDVAKAALKHLPGDSDGEYWYCYNRENEDSSRNYYLRDNTRYIAGQVHFFHASAYDGEKTFSMNSRERLYVSTGNVQISFHIKEKDISSVARVFKQVYPDGCTDQKVEEIFNLFETKSMGFESKRMMFVTVARAKDVNKWRKMLRGWG